jgi:hypothetical protein
VTSATIAEQLQAVLDDVWRLRPSWERPERFHEGRSEVIGRLKSLIAEVDSPSGPAAALAIQAKTALARLETAQPPPVEPSPPAPVSSDPPTGDVASAPAPSAEASPPLMLLPVAVVDDDADDELRETRAALRRLGPALTGLLSEIDKLTHAARAAVMAHTLALAVQPAPAPAPMPLPPPMLTPAQPPPLPRLRPHRYTPADLRTEAGQAAAVKAWVRGYTQGDISIHFGWHAPYAAQVSLAIRAFILHQLGGIDLNADRKEQAARALAAYERQVPQTPSLRTDGGNPPETAVAAALG